MENKFLIQEKQYKIPYHYLVDFDNFSTSQNLSWGVEYYGYVSFIIDLLSKNQYTNLLDVGCGDGKLISLLSEKNKEKKNVGYDLSEAAIHLAKGLNFNKKNCQFIYGDFRNDKRLFDVITLIEVLEHIEDNKVNDFIDNIYNKLKPGGKLIVSVPSDNIKLKTKHYRHYNIEMLKKSFSKLTLNKSFFKIKNNTLFRLLCRFSAIFYSFGLYNKIQLFLAKKFIFNAQEKNCRHLICIFEKQN